jgi:hypothetical protein
MEADKLFGKVTKLISFEITGRRIVKKKINQSVRCLARGRMGDVQVAVQRVREKFAQQAAKPKNRNQGW